jgi:hypothetical protein
MDPLLRKGIVTKSFFSGDFYIIFVACQVMRFLSNPILVYTV